MADEKRQSRLDLVGRDSHPTGNIPLIYQMLQAMGRTRIPAMWEDEQYSGDMPDLWTIPISEDVSVRPEFQYGVYGDGRGIYADPYRNLYKGLTVRGRF